MATAPFTLTLDFSAPPPSPVFQMTTLIGHTDHLPSSLQYLVFKLPISPHKSDRVAYFLKFYFTEHHANSFENCAQKRNQ